MNRYWWLSINVAHKFYGACQIVVAGGFQEAVEKALELKLIPSGDVEVAGMELDAEDIRKSGVPCHKLLSHADIPNPVRIDGTPVPHTTN